MSTGQFHAAEIGAAVVVRQQLGPGLLESAYVACICFELLDRGLSLEREVVLPVVYRGRRVDCGYRIDLLEDLSIVEVDPFNGWNAFSVRSGCRTCASRRRPLACC